MSVIDYKIISGPGVEQLSQKINDMTNDGYSIIGRAFTRGGYIFQTVGKGTYSIGVLSNYSIVISNGISALENSVNSLLSEDVQPFGEPLLRGDALYQVMGKITPVGGNSGPDVTWDTIQGKPAVIACGANEEEARTSIDALASKTSAEISSAGGALKIPSGTSFEDALKMMVDVIDPSA